MNKASRRLRAASLLAVAAMAVAACGSDSGGSSTTGATEATSPSTESAPSASTAPSDTTVTTDTTATTDNGGSGDTGVTTEGISDERCAENKAAGTITYASSFDFAAAASIVDVVVAKQKGYFDEMCLDVDLKPGFSTSNYPLIAAGTANFSSAGNYTEIINNSGDGANFVAVVDYGKEPIEALITPDGGAETLPALEGKTIGVKGDIPPSIVAMLAKAGLQRGKDYKELLLDGFDPVAQLSSGIDALPVYKSNEPGQLDAAGVIYNLFDPADDDIPGSFGIIYTSKEYAEAHPTVVEDFTRAALHGMEFALADIPGAVAISVDMINANGNQNYLTSEGETYRWTQESAIVEESTPAGEPVGLIHGDLFKNEYDAYVDAGVWPDGAPEYLEAYDDTVAKSVYDADGKVIWPAG